VLIIWDRLFGTFVDERNVSELKYGLTSRQPTTLNPLRLNVDELIQMFKDVWRFRDLKILVMPPGYVDEKYPLEQN
jgi:sterol desaturase/sphingolipid hydroxylase (fatty acid hydroxylase superfamily)